ncbi:HPr family phosphocarrier protein [Aquibacillus koreensis]|uniref:HPr family phosphocarrier protein n=1 Tax=Aquibacillus koreensis TaxID=279446 RepID=A0A9X3WQP6_9BACI|nr:HPr family phosphocarrier protein [Aquibacillus koreensis]MCT2537317.1 HPr family phosphocarrier protein [Aquibacillus koreensis]MDC3421664.1 HPr family phosphocarrier protein [Aquibacillus koreensis]
MVEKSVVVELPSGLQARPAAQFVQKANSYAAELFIEKGSKRVNAKSIMGLMSLAIASGEEIKIIADGSDDEDALEELVLFVSDGK